MAVATSPVTGQAYGVKRVCAIWGVARSSFYDARRQQGRPQQSPAGRRGPKPRHSDEDLLAAIRHDLARSPWAGEGHRKVWARLRVIDGIRVGRRRVLRQGLSPAGDHARLGVFPGGTGELHEDGGQVVDVRVAVAEEEDAHAWGAGERAAPRSSQADCAEGAQAQRDREAKDQHQSPGAIRRPGRRSTER